MEEKKSKKWLIWIIIIIVLTNVFTFVMTAFGIWHLPNRYVIRATSEGVANDAKKFATLESEITSRYYKKVSRSTLTDKAYHAMFKAIGDPYSEYYSKTELDALKSEVSGEYEGIGVVVGQNDKKDAVIMNVYAKTPAANAGMKAGDIISAVNGVNMRGKGVNAVVSKIRGKQGTSVKVTYLRDKDSKTVTVKRSAISLPTVNSEVYKTKDNKSYGIISVSQFGDNTGNAFKSAVKSLSKKKVSGLIIDLRWNGGGVVDSATEAADTLLDGGTIFKTTDKNGKKDVEKANAGTLINVPTAVLVNGSTASASEIFAGALQDHGKAILVGEKTYGKGVIQEMVPLSDGTGYKLTIEQYQTPNGHNINKKGLTPDINVKLKLKKDDETNQYSLKKEDDNQLQTAIQALQKQTK